MEKQKVVKEIFCKFYEGTLVYGVPFKDLPKDLNDDDMIRTFEDDSDEYNGMYYTVLTVHREELETDEEFEKRNQHMEELKERNAKARYENYLKLKEEFEIKQ